MEGGFTRRIIERVRALSPAAFKAVDELCKLLEGVEPVSPAIIALRIACEARKAFRRGKRA